MKKRDSLKSLGIFLHRLSHVAVVFMLAALYYQFKAFMTAKWAAGADPEAFVKNFIISMTLWGFFMAFLSLADIESMKPKEIKKMICRQTRLRWVLIFMIIGFLAAVILGLFLLLFNHDELLGVANISFGMGGLGMSRQMHDRLKYVQSLPETYDNGAM